jgi:hypothetical protein
VVAADGAVVHHDVPGPQRDGVPLLHFKSGASVMIVIFGGKNT